MAYIYISLHCIKKKNVQNAIEMATHSSVLPWRIPGMAEPGGLPSMGSHRVGHDWSDLEAAAADSMSSNMLFLTTANLKLDIYCLCAC